MFNKNKIVRIYLDKLYSIKKDSYLFNKGDIVSINFIYLQKDNVYRVSCTNITKGIDFQMTTNFKSFYQKFDIIEETDIKVINRIMKLNKICSRLGIK